MSRGGPSTELSALGLAVAFDEAVCKLYKNFDCDIPLEDESVAFLHESLSQLTGIIASRARQRLGSSSNRMVSREDIVHAINATVDDNLAKNMTIAASRTADEFAKGDTPEKRWKGCDLSIDAQAVHGCLRSFMDEGVTVFLCAAVEYVCMEVFTAVCNYAQIASRKKTAGISTKDILSTVEDKGLRKVLKNAKKGLKASRSKEPFELTRSGSGMLNIPAGLAGGKLLREGSDPSLSGSRENLAGDAASRSFNERKKRRTSVFGLKQMFRSKSADENLVLDENDEGTQQSPQSPPAARKSSKDAGSPATAPVEPVQQSLYIGSLEEELSFEFGLTSSPPAPRPSKRLSLTRSDSLPELDTLRKKAAESERLSVRGAEPRDRRRLASVLRDPTLAPTVRKQSLLAAPPAAPPATTSGSKSPTGSVKSSSGALTTIKVMLPEGLSTMVPVTETMLVREVLSKVCRKRMLEDKYYQLRLTDGSPLDPDVPFCVYGVDECGCHKKDDKVEHTMAQEGRVLVITEDNRDVLVMKMVDGRVEVVSGTLDKLIERVADDHNTDKDYVSTLLLTYRAFLHPAQLFEKLVGRYRLKLSDSPTQEEVDYFNKWKGIIQQKVIGFVLRWVEDYFFDFYENKHLLDDLMDFCEVLSTDGFAARATELSIALKAMLEKCECADLQLLPVDKSNLSRERTQRTESVSFTKAELVVDILAMNPKFLAEQMTICDHQLFRNVHPVEFLHHLFAGEKVVDYCPNLNRLISRFNKESHWIATEICTRSEVKERAKVIKRFIKTGKHLVELNNFFAVFSIVGGLNLSPVRRLKKSWEGVNPKAMAMLGELESLMDPSYNMKVYRERLLQTQPPMVPLLPINLKDLLFIHDGNKGYVGDGLVNFEKYRMLASVVREIEAISTVAYARAGSGLVPDIKLQQFLLHPRVHNAMILNQNSRKLEP